MSGSLGALRLIALAAPETALTKLVLVGHLVAATPHPFNQPLDGRVLHKLMWVPLS